MHFGSKTPPVALTIAGSDSGGGAGIQADLKTFASLGVYGTSVITAVTAQNTRGVSQIEIMSLESVLSQLVAVTNDFQVRATKVGMIASESHIRLVADAAADGTLPRLIVDPVMVATSGDRLTSDTLLDAYRNILIPQALVVTPNITEAQELAQMTIESLADMAKAAQIISKFGAKYVYLKGGHISSDEATDLFFDGSNVQYLRAKRINTQNTHGTGCTLSSAIAAYLAFGKTVDEAIHGAKIYITRAISGGANWALGGGHGPLDHFSWGQLP
ncbi:MAG: bifunctional hydroxymethylpyrimidine kinase/phosphomethylpyrimidine kinase [Actinomycetota bacterium]|nr:bifunctional hydroxymethylpyrimidine kinase/phosphomethylpyrimidine kinase [Actinomycetota bacterium]